MSSIEIQEPTVCESMKMHKVSFHKSHTYDNKDISPCAKLVNKDSNEDVNDGIHPKMKLTEARTMPEGKSQVGSVVWIPTKIEPMIVLQIACTTEQIVTKEILAIAVYTLEYILQ